MLTTNCMVGGGGVRTREKHGYLIIYTGLTADTNKSTLQSQEYKRLP